MAKRQRRQRRGRQARRPVQTLHRQETLAVLDIIEWAVRKLREMLTPSDG